MAIVFFNAVGAVVYVAIAGDEDAGVELEQWADAHAEKNSYARWEATARFDIRPTTSELDDLYRENA